jgi:hypothetical protein
MFPIPRAACVPTYSHFPTSAAITQTSPAGPARRTARWRTQRPAA